MVKTLCRDCGALALSATAAERCGDCGSPRLGFSCRARHPGDRPCRLRRLYATVENANGPISPDRPVIIGGGTRGVVLACCYVARLYGVRSAMPMFKALAACPDAVVIRPDMAKYRDVGRAVRTAMLRLTPLVEPLSIDEAFLDLGGTRKLHGECPAQLLAALARQVEAELRITVSIGLSDNKFLAKLASDLDKPRGFAVLSRRRGTRLSRRQAGGAAVGRGDSDAAPAGRRRNCLDRATRQARRARARCPLWPAGGAAGAPRAR